MSFENFLGRVLFFIPSYPPPFHLHLCSMMHVLNTLFVLCPTWIFIIGKRKKLPLFILKCFDCFQYYESITKPIDCPALFNNPNIDVSSEFDKPPKEIPGYL